jgi:hypothetical protein
VNLGGSEEIVNEIRGVLGSFIAEDCGVPFGRGVLVWLFINN